MTEILTLKINEASGVSRNSDIPARESHPCPDSRGCVFFEVKPWKMEKDSAKIAKKKPTMKER